MSLQKGFLRPKITLQTLNLDSNKLIGGLIVWGFLSFSIYSFLYMFREYFRVTSIWWNKEDFLILSPTENYFYNFFYACLACLIAFTIISNHWLRRASSLKDIPRYRKVAIYHDKVSLSWYFIYWFSKTTFLFGVLSCSFGVFQELSFYPEYKAMLFMILASLFLHQWLALRLVYKNSVLRMMVLSFLVIGLTSSMFACINLVSYKEFNQSILKTTIAHNLSISLPELESRREYERKHLLINIYVGFKKDDADSVPKIAVRNFPSPVSIITADKLNEFVLSAQSLFDEFSQNEIRWRLNIDKNVKMKYVKELKDSLSRCDARRIQYASSDDHINGLVSNLGLMQLLPVHESSDFPQSPFFMVGDDDVVLELLIRNDTIWFQDLVVSPVKIRTIVRNFVKRNGRSGIVRIDVDDESSFESYITLIDQLILIVTELRDEWAFNNYRIHYVDLDPYDSDHRGIDDSTRVLFPMRFIDK